MENNRNVDRLTPTPNTSVYEKDLVIRRREKKGWRKGGNMNGRDE